MVFRVHLLETGAVHRLAFLEDMRKLLLGLGAEWGVRINAGL